MNSIVKTGTRTCGHCHRTLPAEDFYVVNKRIGKLDSYCKLCRRLSNLHRRRSAARPCPEAPAPRRTLISEEPDPQRRMQLILQARAKVRESVLRKRERLREAEEL